jgi:hypothetical protein
MERINEKVKKKPKKSEPPEWPEIPPKVSWRQRNSLSAKRQPNGCRNHDRFSDRVCAKTGIDCDYDNEEAETANNRMHPSSYLGG